MTRAKASIASWLPWAAASSCWRSGGGGSRVASSQVSSYMGRTWRSRVVWYSAMAASKGRAPEKAWSRAAAHSSASRKASCIPWAVMKSLL